MKNALILHGAANNSSGNWFPWLKTELEKKGYTVWSPDLPNSDTPIQSEWIDTIISNKDWEFNQDSVMIGHSAGGTLILRILERLPASIQINTSVLVAAPLDKGQFPQFYQYKEDICKDPFDFNKIKKTCRKFVFFASDNDPYDCGDRHAKVMHEKLGGELVIKEGQGHFNLEVNPPYKEFPELLSYL